MSDTGIMICAVCRRVLDRYADEDGMGYRHTVQDQRIAIHAPQPIPMPDDYREGRCDFCNLDQMAFALPVRDFQPPGLSGHMSMGDWAACLDCARLIDGNRWTDLVTRVISIREGQFGETTDPVHYNRLYRAVRKNISGSLRPL